MSAKISLFSVSLLLLGSAYAVCPDPVPSDFRRVTLEAGQIREPMDFDFLDSGKILVCERRTGFLKLHIPGRKLETAGKLKVAEGKEDGLMGLVADPGFASNRWIYVYYTVKENRQRKNLLSRFEFSGNRLDLASEIKILVVPTEGSNSHHAGGGMVFDGKGNLYIGTGDNADHHGYSDKGYAPLDERPGYGNRDAQKTAANSNDLRGKILRIHPEPDGGYTVPAGNLFQTGTPGARPEIYAMGCRNPFRLTIDTARGWLYFGDGGPDAKRSHSKRGPLGYDEINLAVSAGNFGWPYFIGNNLAYPDFDFATGLAGPNQDPGKPINRSPNNGGLQFLPRAMPPLIWYAHFKSEAFPQMGSGDEKMAMAGPIYRYNPYLRSPKKFPSWFHGKLFVWDWSRSLINTVAIDPFGKLISIDHFDVSDHGIQRNVAMKFGPDGALYVLQWGERSVYPYSGKDELYRIEYAPKNSDCANPS